MCGKVLYLRQINKLNDFNCFIDETAFLGFTGAILYASIHPLSLIHSQIVLGIQLPRAH